MSQSQLDVLAVGDVVTDAFIKLLDGEAKVEENKDGGRLSMAYGAKVPFEYSEVIPAVGNAANAAAAFAKLGLKVGLVSNIGSDRWGREILTALHKAKVDSRFVHINPGKASHYHYVLWYKEDRTILIKGEDYDYNWPTFRVVDIPKWVYFSSVNRKASEYQDEIIHWLEAHPPVKLAFQPGTFQIDMGAVKLKKLYNRTEVLALNREEASEVSGVKSSDIHSLFDALHSLGPRIVMISDGPKGAYASDGENRWQMPIYPDPKPPYERTGAGDAFSATFVAALMHGADIETALLWAPINSMSVVQKVGAQAGLLTPHQIDHFLRIAPKSYHPERMRR